jgi:two-component system invasion response regulator UvrY
MPVNILIVEDDANVRRLLGQWLSLTFPWCQVLEAATGEDGVRLAQSVSPRVVIMDISLPGISGIEATRRIKASVPGTEVVFLTIHEAEAYRKDAASAGASAYVSKRKMQTELIPVLERMLSRSADARLKRAPAL